MVREQGGNIFFDINTGLITITSACSAEGAVVAPANSVTAAAGNAALNLGLSPQFSTAFTPTGTLGLQIPLPAWRYIVPSACPASQRRM